jgi:hypothetical protein
MRYPMSTSPCWQRARAEVFWKLLKPANVSYLAKALSPCNQQLTMLGVVLVYEVNHRILVIVHWCCLKQSSIEQFKTLLYNFKIWNSLLNTTTYPYPAEAEIWPTKYAFDMRRICIFELGATMHILKICILESAVTMHIPEVCIFVKCVAMHIRKYAYHKNPATMTMNIRNMHSHSRRICIFQYRLSTSGTSGIPG